MLNSPRQQRIQQQIKRGPLATAGYCIALLFLIALLLAVGVVERPLIVG